MLMGPINSDTTVVVTIASTGMKVFLSTFPASAVVGKPGYAAYFADLAPAWDSSIASEGPEHSR